MATFGQHHTMLNIPYIISSNRKTIVCLCQLMPNFVVSHQKYGIFYIKSTHSRYAYKYGNPILLSWSLKMQKLR